MRNSTAPDLVESMKAPHKNEQGFVCHLDAHWFALRSIGPFWFDLNSKHLKPKLITPFHLCAWLSELRKGG